MAEEVYLDYVDVGEGEQHSITLVFNDGDTAEIRYDGIYRGDVYIPFSSIIGALREGMSRVRALKG